MGAEFRNYLGGILPLLGIEAGMEALVKAAQGIFVITFHNSEAIRVRRKGIF